MGHNEIKRETLPEKIDHILASDSISHSIRYVNVLDDDDIKGVEFDGVEFVAC